MSSHKRGDDTPVSLWNDIALYEAAGGKRTGNVNFVCEIPKTTRKKYEIATDEFIPFRLIASIE